MKHSDEKDMGLTYMMILATEIELFEILSEKYVILDKKIKNDMLLIKKVADAYSELAITTSNLLEQEIEKRGSTLDKVIDKLYTAGDSFQESVVATITGQYKTLKQLRKFNSKLVKSKTFTKSIQKALKEYTFKKPQFNEYIV